MRDIHVDTINNKLHKTMGTFYNQDFDLMKATPDRKLKITLSPENFAQLTMAPIFPTISSKKSKWNKQANYRLCKKLFGKTSYKDIQQLYAEDKVSMAQYKQVLESNSFGLVTGTRDYNANTYVCLDADSHEDRRSNEKTQVDDDLMKRMETNLFDENAVVIKNQSQSGNSHLYGVSNELDRQSIKGLIYKDEETSFELDLKTSNNYVLIKGNGYGNMEIVGEAQTMLDRAEKNYLAIFKDTVYDVNRYAQYVNAKPADKLRVLINLGVVLHVNIFAAQDLDTKIGTNLIKAKSDIRKAKPSHSAKLAEIKKGNKTSAKFAEINKNSNHISRKLANARNNFGGIVDNTPLPKEYETTDKPDLFKYDIATPRFKHFGMDCFTDEYTQGTRGSTLVSVAAYLYLSNWTEDEAIDFISEVDNNSSSSLFRDGLEKEIITSVHSGFSGDYRPDRELLHDVFGFDPYEKIGLRKSDFKQDGNDEIIPDVKKGKRKRYSDLKQLHNNSLVSAILIGFKQEMSETSTFSYGNKAKIKTSKLVDRVNLDVLNPHQARSYKSISTVLRNVFTEFSKFTPFDYLMLLDYKVNGGRFIQKEQDLQKQLQPAIARYFEILSKADVFKRAIHFQKMLSNNKQLLGYLTFNQISELSRLKTTLKRGINGGVEVEVVQSSFPSLNEFKQILSNETLQHKLEKLDMVLKAHGMDTENIEETSSFKRIPEKENKRIYKLCSYVTAGKVKYYNNVGFVNIQTGEIIGDELVQKVYAQIELHRKRREIKQLIDLNNIVLT